MNQASQIFGGVQVISQLNQNIWDRGVKKSVERYFNFTNKGVNQIICIRGEKKIRAIVSSARLKVDAHSVKRVVIALKYEDEEGYRY